MDMQALHWRGFLSFTLMRVEESQTPTPQLEASP